MQRRGAKIFTSVTWTKMDDQATDDLAAGPRVCVDGDNDAVAQIVEARQQVVALASAVRVRQGCSPPAARHEASARALEPLSHAPSNLRRKGLADYNSL